MYYNGSVYNSAASRLAQQPPFSVTTTLVTGVDNLLTLANGFAASPDASILNTYAVARNYRVGYAQTWNLSVQHNFPRLWCSAPLTLVQRARGSTSNAPPTAPRPASPATTARSRTRWDSRMTAPRATPFTTLAKYGWCAASAAAWRAICIHLVKVHRQRLHLRRRRGGGRAV
ncbi:MAG: hypothetical protein R2724_32890 [Bryobacterales bacterium]